MKLFQHAIELDPACASFEIGNILAASGDLQGAVECYQRALNADPNWLMLHSEIAVLLARQRRFDAAIVHAQLAVIHDPSNADAFYNLGSIMIQ